MCSPTLINEMHFFAFTNVEYLCFHKTKGKLSFSSGIVRLFLLISNSNRESYGKMDGRSQGPWLKTTLFCTHKENMSRFQGLCKDQRKTSAADYV